MRRDLKALLARNLDVLAFAAALITVGLLMAWWSLLVHRNISMMDRLVRSQAELLPAGPERLHTLADIDAQTQRQMFMIFGESTLACVLLLTLAVVLFMVARNRLAENGRMQTLLQLTSHQLKTPVAGVRTLLQSLENGSIPPELQRQFLARGVAECDRLEHLVETILAYQRAVVRRDPRLEIVTSSQVVGDILDHRATLFPAEHQHWGARVTATLSCDPEAFHVVMENLLDNARKYGGGQVTLSESTHGETWRLAIQDRGQGFEMAQSERLFEPFERGGGAGVAHGSGLGLFISRQLMRRMGGELYARSDGPGKGATFTMELPLAPAEARRAEVVHG
jgi:signal transduction histidine kinase